MQGKEKGLIGLIKKREDIPTFATFNYIIHQEALVAKLKDCDLQKVMQQVVRVVNIIIARALNHRQFRQLLEEWQT